MAREITVWVGNTKLAGLKESGQNPGEWVFYPCLGSDQRHVTIHDPNTRYSDVLVHMSRRSAPGERAGVFHWFPLGDRRDAQGNPETRLTGVMRSQTRPVDMGFITFLSPMPKSSSAIDQSTRLVIPDLDFDWVTIHAAVGGAKDEAPDWYQSQHETGRWLIQDGTASPTLSVMACASSSP